MKRWLCPFCGCIWSGVFWSPAETVPAKDLGAAAAVGVERRAGGPVLMVAPTALLVARPPGPLPQQPWISMW